MVKTDNYELNIAEGTDKYNHFTFDNTNYEIIDEELKNNADAGTQVATELYTDTIHAITRLHPDAAVFRFTAVSRFTAGDTFTVDDVQVSALTTSGEQLPDGAFVIGSEVLCALKGTRLTVYLSTSSVNKAKDSDKLGGFVPDHFATAGDLADVAQVAQAAGDLAEENTQEIAQINQKLVNMLTWKRIGSVVGTANTLPLPSDWKEINVSVYLTSNMDGRGFSFSLNREQVKTHRVYMDGFWQTTTGNGMAMIKASETDINMVTVYSGGSDALSSYTMEVYYR